MNGGRRTVIVASFILLLSVPCAGQSSPCVVDQHTLALWHFEDWKGGTTRDAAADERAAELVGKALSIEGRFGSGVMFDGKSAKMIVRGSGGSDIILPGQGMTVEAWVKPSPQTKMLTQQVYRSAPAFQLEIRKENGAPSFSARGRAAGD